MFFSDLKSSSGYPVPSATFTGDAMTRFAAPEGYSLWINTGTVAAGSSLEWPGDHGDEAIYVESGRVGIEGTEVGPRSTVIIERRARTRLSFLEDSTVVHFGQSEISPPLNGSRGGGQVHVHSEAVSRKGYTETLTETCPHCEIVILRVSDDQPHVGRAHSHDRDELQYVISGDLRVGRNRLKSGMGMAIPKDRIYSFRTDEGFEFLNYRSGPAGLTWARDAH